MKYFSESHDEVLDAIARTIPLFSHDQHRLYTAADQSRWQPFLVRRLDDLLQSAEGQVFYELMDGCIYLVGCRIPRWDEEHFGIKMAKIEYILYPDESYSPSMLRALVDECISELHHSGVKFISAHLSGSDLPSQHLLEEKGFRYYQTTVYAVAESKGASDRPDPAVRLWCEEDVPRVVEIARHNQFPGGHFLQDQRFDRATVHAMYEKWILTSWKKGDPIAVIENDGKVAGYFAFVMDRSLSDAMGFEYGRMTSLSLDSTIHRKGLGASLFRSVVAMIGQNGGQYVSTEYPLKNYASGKLHSRNGFVAVHEKVLTHLWLQ